MNEFYGQAYRRYVAVLVAEWEWALVALVAALGYLLYQRFLRDRALPRWTPHAVCGVVLVLGLFWVWHVRWLGDDAFISFRYARNWAEGRGLVFNPGERVEGYTNFLWVAVLAAAHRIGLSIPLVALFGCIACYIGVLYLVLRIVRGELDAPVVSLAAIALAFCYPFVVYATGGLETMFSTFLVVLALERASRGAHLAAGAAGIGATMSHPDHAIFYVVLGIALLVRRTGARGLIAYAAPFVVVYVPYFLIRWSYFGDFFPNTYYTKSAHDPYYSQGLFYLFASALTGGVFGVLPLFGHGMATLRNRFLQVYAALALLGYFWYVARVGGDYMIGRLLISGLPTMFIVAELGLRDLMDRRRFVLAGVGCALAVTVLLPTRILRPMEVRWGLSDETTHFRLATISPLKLEGGIPRRVDTIVNAMRDASPAPSYAAYAIGYLGWTSDWPIVDLHGLTDRELARQPLRKRGRPGHERVASPGHVYKRGATISALEVHHGRGDLVGLWIGDQGFHLVRYVPSVMRGLKGKPGVRFVDFEAYLDDYIASLAAKSPALVTKDLAFFDRYYFSVADDPARRAQLAAYVAERAPLE